MIVKVFTIITVYIGLCKAEILPRPLREPTSNQASSSVNFHRQDVPLAYQYSAFHPQAVTTKQEQKLHEYQQSQKQNPITYQSIQYAPLMKPPGPLTQDTKFNQVYFQNLETQHDPKSPNTKKALEPRVEELSSTASVKDSSYNLRGHSVPNLDYIPGHNIEVLRSSNRYPAHNAVYRSYTDRNPTIVDTHKKINYLNQYIIHPKQRENDYTTSFRIHVDATKGTTPKIHTATGSTTSTTTPKPVKNPYEPPKQYYIPKPITYFVEKPIAAEKSPYTKMHSLLLNVARAYNLAMHPHKNQHTNYNPNLLAQIQNFGLTNQNYIDQSRMKVTGSIQPKVPLTDQKTILYPIQKNTHYTYTI